MIPVLEQHFMTGVLSSRICQQYNKEMEEKGDHTMDFIEKIGDTITEKGKVAADKAKELAAIANLKSQISTCEEVMKKNYLEIGKIYFEQYSDMPEPPFEKQCEIIKNSQKAIADLQEKIEQLKTK